MATPLRERQGGLQLPQDYRRAIVDIVKIWTNNGKESLHRWPGLVDWIKGMARVGHRKLELENRVRERPQR